MQLQPVVQPLVPREIAVGIKALLGRAEATAGLASGETKSDEERLKAVIEPDQPLRPALYTALHPEKE